jgi:serine/tyrosine/threonine adenylyltransferase
MTNKVNWNFDNSYSRLPETFYTQTNPKPVKAPKLIKLNESLADSLGLAVEQLRDEECVAVFAGNLIPEGAKPLAQAYAGHQFGHFTMLGDGRAILLGEQMTANGERFDIQLKGPGRTPYSRGGDGRAAIGPMLREYIISEAMYALGIPTTRSLAVVETGESVIRETKLPGAILTRVAASHIRVGTFEYAARFGSVEELRALAEYTLDRHFSYLKEQENQYLSMLEEVIQRQASLIAKWQLVGFIHGVMNTDNMTISGETIDYGPCAFMDTYNPATVFSSIDRNGRYAYSNQPYIALWNLTRFAETLIPLLDKDQEQAIKLAEGALSGFSEKFQSYWISGMRAKLGLVTEEAEDQSLATELLAIMDEYRADFTNTFRALTIGKLDDSELFTSSDFTKWYENWESRLKQQDGGKKAAQELMRKHNPNVIPRNHRVEEALKAAEVGDLSVLEKLLVVLSKPFDYSEEQAEYCKLAEPSNRPYQTYCGT